MNKNILSETIWQQKYRDHKKRVNDKLRDYFINRSNHQKNPVIDFLFEYYSFGFSELKRWSPGVGVFLQGESAQSFLRSNLYKEFADGIAVNIEMISEKRHSSLYWILEIMEKVKERSPFLGCMGLHEWAMVYRLEQVRHSLPLRMTPEQLAAFVENNHIRCSHYDAYRFFSKKAIPLNELSPTKETRQSFEQPGCLHTNMDLYKWAHKFYPWIGSDLIMDTFDLAWEIREADMRASPYDLTSLGYEPILLELPQGRQEYAALQKKFSEKAQPLRQRLIEAYHNIVNLLENRK